MTFTLTYCLFHRKVHNKVSSIYLLPSKDKITYTITFTLTKEDDEWTLDDITDIDRQKIHGIYDN